MVSVNTGKLKIVYVSCRRPWPTIGGREGIIERYLQMLSLNDEVHLAAFNSDAAEIRNDRLASFTSLPRSTVVDILFSAVRNPLSPLQCHFIGGRGARRLLKKLVGRVKPDVIVFDMIRLYDLGAAIGHYSLAKAVIDLDDLISIRYERLQGRNAGTNLLGTFAKFLPGFAITGAATLPGLLLKIEAWLVRRAECRIDKRFAGAILLSHREADLLAERLGGTIPILVAPPALVVPRRVMTPPDEAVEFAFVGNAYTAPNAEALSLFDEIACELRHRLPNAPLRFRSYGPSNAGLNLRQVEVRGFVEDLDAIFHENLVVVAPVMSGSGVKIKVLDAMMRGVPVVTSSLGVEGIQGLTAQMRLCESKAEFVEYLTAIATGTVTLQELRKNARELGEHVRARHDYATVASRLRAFLRKIVDPGATACVAPEHIPEESNSRMAYPLAR